MFRLPLPDPGLCCDHALMLAGLLPLAAILYAAARAAFREGIVPNALVLIGVAAGLLLNAVLPAGEGFLAQWPGGLGPGGSLVGMAVGAVAMLPFYLLRTVRGGDLKLMAVVGAFLGPADVVPAILGTLLAGGAMALVGALHRGSFARLLVDCVILARSSLLRQWPPAQALRALPARPGTPYALAVAAGTLGSVLCSLTFARPL